MIEILQLCSLHPFRTLCWSLSLSKETLLQALSLLYTLFCKHLHLNLIIQNGPHCLCCCFCRCRLQRSFHYGKPHLRVCLMASCLVLLTSTFSPAIPMTSWNESLPILTSKSRLVPLTSLPNSRPAISSNSSLSSMPATTMKLTPANTKKSTTTSVLSPAACLPPPQPPPPRPRPRRPSQRPRPLSPSPLPALRVS